jgi:hypothetical protein
MSDWSVAQVFLLSAVDEQTAQVRAWGQAIIDEAERENGVCVRSIYLMRAEGGPYKIGISNDPERRRNELQQSMPCRLALLCQVEIGLLTRFEAQPVETRVHDRFQHRRRRFEDCENPTEWFDLSDAEVAAFAQVWRTRCGPNGGGSGKGQGPGSNLALCRLGDRSQQDIGGVQGSCWRVDPSAPTWRLPRATMGATEAPLGRTRPADYALDGGGRLGAPPCSGSGRRGSEPLPAPTIQHPRRVRPPSRVA